VLLSKTVSIFVLVLLCARPVLAEDQNSSSAVSNVDSSRWEPAGPPPVDQAGTGRRGYVLPADSADVADPGAHQISVHTVAANSFYREEANGFLISQRYEAHTVAFGFRRGFKVSGFRRVELGGQIQFHESDNGMLNGFISGFEGMWVSMTGSESARNPLRANAATLPPLGMFITKDNQPVYQAAGHGRGFGDVSLVAKALLTDGVAARVALNVAGASAFSEGNVAGVGLSVDRMLARWAAFHGDLRANILLDRVSQWGLPLRRASLAMSAGPELKLTRNSSLGLQIDAGATPYLPTGAAAFDEGYGDITFGFNHRVSSGRRPLLVQIYARENMNLPFRVRWNTDPDLSIGMKISVLR